MPYGTPPTVDEVLAEVAAGKTDYTVGWRGMLEILAAEVTRLRTEVSDKRSEAILDSMDAGGQPIVKS